MAITSFIVAGEYLTRDCEPRTRGYRDYLIIHHAAGTSLDVTLNLMQPGGRTVSSNWVLGKDGKFWRVVPENLRAWTSSSWLDDIATTVEVVNQSGDPTWGISEDQHLALAYLAVRLFREGHLKELSRRYIIGHNEVSKYAPGTSYATACPGPSMNLNHIVELAIQIHKGLTVLEPEKGITMKYLNVVGGNAGIVGELSFTTYTEATHPGWVGHYRTVASSLWDGEDVSSLVFDVARQDALNRRAAFLADIRSATSSIDPAVLKAAVKEAVDAAFADDDTDNDTIDVAAIVQGVANELADRLRPTA